MMRRFVIGDIHGSFRGLEQVLNIVNFDYKEDLLICLGDVCDRWSEVKECCDLLMTIEKLILIKGNHDNWALRYYDEIMGRSERIHWYNHGGEITIKSFGENPEKYIDFLKSAYLYYELDEMIFAHASVCDKEDLGLRAKIKPDFFFWDRQLVREIYDTEKYVRGYQKVFLGHTQTLYFEEGNDQPIIKGNVYFMDTGAALNGRITLMNIDTEEYFQSDKSMNLYPEEYQKRKLI